MSRSVIGGRLGISFHYIAIFLIRKIGNFWKVPAAFNATLSPYLRPPLPRRKRFAKFPKRGMGRYLGEHAGGEAGGIEPPVLITRANHGPQRGRNAHRLHRRLCDMPPAPPHDRHSSPNVRASRRRMSSRHTRGQYWPLASRFSLGTLKESPIHIATFLKWFRASS